MAKKQLSKHGATAKFAAWSCVHSPYICEDSKAWLLNNLTNTRGLTHAVILGDLFESSAASVHPDEVKHELEYEYEVAAGYLKDVRSVLPRNCKLVWTLGNHDYNLKSPDPRRIPLDIRSLCNWNNHYEFGKEFRRWEQLPYIKSAKCVYSLGKVKFYHGFDAGTNSDELEGLQMNYMTGGGAHTLMVRGHTHRPTVSGSPVQCKRSAKVLLPNFFVNVGHQRAMDARRYPEFMKRRDTSQWGNGMLLGETLLKTGRNSGKCWSAELLVR
jgi:predicted phosphodiesterase